MSSATSIDDAVASTDAGKDRGATSTFSAWHFFILLSLIAASVAVVLAQQNSPENLLLISLTIGAAGAAAFALYRVLAPLTAPDTEPLAQPLSERLRADLEREKMLALRAIKELEFDRAMGKVSEQDFEDMALRLRTRAMGIIRQLDDGRTSYRAAIERELLARLEPQTTQPSRPQTTQTLQPQTTQTSQPQTTQTTPTSQTCSCGTANDIDAAFCKRCGTRLAATESIS
jgi:hypothetical protein